jgi:hypothetical protein
MSRNKDLPPIPVAVTDAADLDLDVNVDKV